MFMFIYIKKEIYSPSRGENYKQQGWHTIGTVEKAEGKYAIIISKDGTLGTVEKV